MWLIQSVMSPLLVFSVPLSCPGRDRELIFRLELSALLLLAPLLRRTLKRKPQYYHYYYYLSDNI